MSDKKISISKAVYMIAEDWRAEYVETKLKEN